MNRSQSATALCVCLFSLALVAKCQARVDLSGHWKSGAIANPGQGKQPPCTWAGFMNRTLTLRSSGELSAPIEGEWKKETMFVWLTNDGGKCRWRSESTFALTLTSTVTYAVKASYVGGSEPELDVYGTFKGCEGNGCETLDMAETKRPFHTKMVYRGGRLLDTDPEAKGFVGFIREQEADATVAEAIKAADKSMVMLDQGDFDTFLGGVWSHETLNADLKARATQTLSAARANRGPVDSRSFVRAVYGEYSAENAKALGDFVLLLRDVKTTKGLMGQEFTLMGKQEGTWRLVWIEYSCNGPCAVPNGDATVFGR